MLNYIDRITRIVELQCKNCTDWDEDQGCINEVAPCTYPVAKCDLFTDLEVL